MALTSVFYDGPVTETSRAQNRAGAPDYGVYGEDDFKVTTHPSIPYALTVKAGKAHGHGVTDTAAADQVVQCATLSGDGAVRYDLIVVRRNWQPLLGGPSTLVAIQGGSTIPNINTLRLKTPGIEDDQPIALVKWQGNQNTPAQIIDLRCWAGNGGMVAADLMALDYLERPGADVLVGNTTWRHVLGANNAWGWVGLNSVQSFGFVQPNGWALSGTCRVAQAGGGLRRVDLDVNISRTAGAFNLGSGFTYLGAVLADQVRGNSGGVKYLPLAVSGGQPENNRLAMASVNTATGQIGFRSTEGTWGWQPGANATINITYYI